MQNFGFVYLPKHFPLAQGLVPYREQIGKRPPFATLELMWSPYQGEQLIVSGFVHPPTETNIREAFAQHGITEFATVKGWEGSVDLPRSRIAIIGVNHGDRFERLTLSAKNYGFSSEDPAIVDASQMATKIISALNSEPSEYLNSVLWNCGFYLWLYGIHDGINEAIVEAKEIISSGRALQKFKNLGTLCNTF
jgi:anthranilate phosphoribosyltransferase